LIVLYRAPYSTNVERVALALGYKGLEVESVVIDYSDRSAVERVSGQGLVPVIDDDGRVVADSIRILSYLEERYPEPQLCPREPARRAELDVFLEWFDEVWKGPPNEIEAELRAPAPDPDRIGALAGQMAAWLDLFERMLDGRDNLLGDAFSAADCAAFPFLKYARSRDPADDEPFHRILDEHQRLGDDHPRLGAWIDAVNQRPRAY
jgi:glutathione S-transferase